MLKDIDMSNSVYKSYEPLHFFHVAGLNLLQGSDQHFPVEEIDQFITLLVDQIRGHNPEAVILNGDLFDASRGESVQQAVGDLLRAVASGYEGRIIYVPGNHCLRGAGDDAWARFGRLPANVHAPLNNPVEPIILQTAKGKIVCGNLFYDFNFSDPALFDLTRNDILHFYKNSYADGRYLLGGRIDLFPIMADNLARALEPDTKILITHCLPHPILNRFRIAARTEITNRLERDHGIRFLYGSDRSNQGFERNAAERWGVSVEDYRSVWNLKSFVMGSNVLERDGFNPAPHGLIVFSGHNHSAAYEEVSFIGDRKIVFCGHQPRSLSKFDQL